MAISFRKSQILDIARDEGKVEVDDLARRFGVSTQTIRRDLGDLASEGKLDRVHGGALIPVGAANIGYAERRRINAGAKAAIARACAARIPENSSVLLNIGSTTEAVARELLGHRNLTVVTNNLNVANILAQNESLQIILTGGLLRVQDGGLIGDIAARVIEEFKVDHAVIGTSAIDPDGDLMDYDLQEVRVSRAIIARSRQTILVADQSKLQRTAPVRIGSLRDIDVLITDALPDTLVATCREWQTEVVLVP